MHPHDTTPELWRPIPGWSDTYAVSTYGRVRRERSIPGLPAGYVLTNSRARNGYMRVKLHRAGLGRWHLIHRLVAAAFLVPSPGRTSVNHRNGIKHDNRPGNLEYVTPAENMQHASALGLMATGDRNGSRLYPERLRRGTNHPTQYKDFHQRGVAHWSHRHPEWRTVGSQHPNAKLTEASVREMRDRFATGTCTLTMLAQQFGVSISVVSKIIHRQSWRHME